MLEELSIRNYALIDSITLSFRRGFNVLTGETGAGKSIIVGSLSFLLGGKTDADVIRSGCEEASVSAVISVKKNNTDAADWLSARDIQCEDDEIIVRRNIKTTGRSTAFIQNVPVTRQDLSEFMALLFDIHGQHNHESLLRKESHRRYLDNFAGIENEVNEFYRVFSDLAEKRKTLDALLKSDSEREDRLELLNYAVDEITKASIKTGEIRELENEVQKLAGYEKLAGLVKTAAECIFESEQSVLTLSRRAKNALDQASSVDASLAEISGRFENLYYEADDIAGEFRSYAEGLSFDPQRQEDVNNRLALLYKLKRKYLPLKKADTFPIDDIKTSSISQYVKNTDAPQAGSEEDAILLYKANAEAEIEALMGAGENRGKLKTEIADIEKDIIAKANILRQKRTAAAEKLGISIAEILRQLGMPNADFQVNIIPKQNEGKTSFGPYGTEDVEFLISPNKGEPLKELARIASGGELSRVMLAIKTVLVSKDTASLEDDSESNNAETLVFDEIDAGIGGEVALKVGDYLVQIGKFKQIFCVTHLASIAVRADNHFKVEKRTEGGRTYTGIGPLSAEGRRKEIARMLAGDAGDAALAHADELIRKYGVKNG